MQAVFSLIWMGILLNGIIPCVPGFSPWLGTVSAAPLQAPSPPFWVGYNKVTRRINVEWEKVADPNAAKYRLAYTDAVSELI